jgi:hypothetical protein
MMNKRKMTLNIMFLAFVFSLTAYFIFKDQDIGFIIENIRNTDTRYWILALICVVLFVGSESVIIYYMMHSIRQKVRMTHCLLYSFVGFFFSCITPSATGGQPAQIYFMKKDKIPIPIGTLILMIVTIAYKLVLVALGVLVLVIRPAKVIDYLQPVMGVCYLGLTINIVFVSFMLLLVFHPTLAHKQVAALIKLLGRMRLVRRADHYMLKLEKAMQQYKDVAGFFRTNRIVIWNVLVITVLQRFLLFLVTYLVYRSFGLKGTDFAAIVVLQGMISVAVDMLPLPGGMGISEKLFMEIFVPVFGSVTLPAMIVSRGFSYYTQLILSAFFTLIAFFTIGRKKMERGKADDRIL